jgi:hypothetical protein
MCKETSSRILDIELLYRGERQDQRNKTEDEYCDRGCPLGRAPAVNKTVTSAIATATVSNSLS